MTANWRHIVSVAINDAVGCYATIAITGNAIAGTLGILSGIDEKAFLTRRELTAHIDNLFEKSD